MWIWLTKLIKTCLNVVLSIFVTTLKIKLEGIMEWSSLYTNSFEEQLYISNVLIFTKSPGNNTYGTDYTRNLITWCDDAWTVVGVRLYEGPRVQFVRLSIWRIRAQQLERPLGHSFPAIPNDILFSVFVDRSHLLFIKWNDTIGTCMYVLIH